MPRNKTVEDLGSSIGPVERETLDDRVYRELKNSIMAGAFKPGSELTLRSVAEALRHELHAGARCHAPSRDRTRLEMRPSRTIAIPVLTADEFLELRRVRLLLEGEAVALAAERISARQLGNVRTILKKLESLDGDRRGQFWALNLKLHFAVYEVGASALLLSIIESLWLQLGPLLARIPVSRALKESADPHQLLVRALEQHDPDRGARRLDGRFDRGHRTSAERTRPSANHARLTSLRFGFRDTAQSIPKNHHPRSHHQKFAVQESKEQERRDGEDIVLARPIGASFNSPIRWTTSSKGCAVIPSFCTSGPGF